MRHNTKAMKRRNGFTLVELLVTIAVLVVLIGIGVPSFRSVVQDNRLATTANSLVRSMNVARSEALERGHDVTVEPQSGGDWESGWEVWSDTDNDGSQDADEIIQTIGAPDGAVSISGGPDEVVYEPSGLTTTNGCFDITDSGSSAARNVDVSPTGRASAGTGSCP